LFRCHISNSNYMIIWYKYEYTVHIHTQLFYYFVFGIYFNSRLKWKIKNFTEINVVNVTAQKNNNSDVVKYLKINFTFKMALSQFAHSDRPEDIFFYLCSQTGIIYFIAKYVGIARFLVWQSSIDDNRFCIIHAELVPRGFENALARLHTPKQNFFELWYAIICITEHLLAVSTEIVKWRVQEKTEQEKHSTQGLFIPQQNQKKTEEMESISWHIKKSFTSHFSKTKKNKNRTEWHLKRWRYANNEGTYTPMTFSGIIHR